MKTIITLVILITFSNANSAILKITSSDDVLFTLDITSQTVVINCEGLFVQATKDDGTGNIVTHDLKFTIPIPECPKVTIDGDTYIPSGAIDNFTDFRYFVFQSNNLSNCRTPDGVLPSQFADYLLLANLETIGVNSIELDVSSWTLNFISADGNLICEGAVSNSDLIFKNSFETIN